MVTIKDSVHDHIELDGVAADLLDTPPVQRLRRIKQLGTVQLVYPSANHTRFEHSLGVYHNASRALASLGIEGVQAERVTAAALLHDVGHGPYSHNVEAVTHRHTGKYHDEVEDLLTDGEVGAVLRDHGLDPNRVAGLIRGEGKFGQLVSGELDVDRMDYLVRDAHHTGVPYGTIDHERLIRELRYADGELVLAEGNVQTAESLLIARALMTPTVYKHHAARVSKAMLRRAAERLIDEEGVTAGVVRRMDDAAFTVALRSHESTRPYAERLADRRLFKRAVWAEKPAVPDDLVGLGHAEVAELERQVADRADVEREAVILDVPEPPSMTESSSRVMVNGDIRTLGQQSPLVNALERAQIQQWRLGVYAPKVDRDRVGKAAVDILGLDIDGARISEVRRGVTATLDEFA
jgi:HD superfamily phosphohydrolase